MQKFYSQYFLAAKGYFSEADPSTQLNYKIEYDELDVKAKLWLLLFEHLILSSGHMVDSIITYNWLIDNKRDVQLLAEKNAILPSLRNDRDNLLDFVLKHPHNVEEVWGARLPVETYKDRARRLDDMFSTAITWSPKSESSTFKDSLIADLQRPRSALRNRLVGLAKESIETIYERLEEQDFITRQILLTLIKSVSPMHLKTFRKYIDLFYHLSGAIEKQSYPILHNDEASLCREKITDEVLQISESSACDLWKELLTTWQVSEATIRNIPLSLIRQIRDDSIGKRLRQTWDKLTIKASLSKPIQEEVNNYIKASQILIKEFEKEFKSQIDKSRVRRRTRKYISTSSWVTGGLGTILGLISGTWQISAFSFAAGVLGFITGDVILDQVEKRLPKTELVLISAQLREASS